MTPAGADSGRTEQGLMLGFPVTGGVSRVLIQDAFIGFEPVLNFDDTVVSDLEVSGIGSGDLLSQRREQRRHLPRGEHLRLDAAQLPPGRHLPARDQL